MTIKLYFKSLSTTKVALEHGDCCLVVVDHFPQTMGPVTGKRLCCLEAQLAMYDWGVWSIRVRNQSPIKTCVRCLRIADKYLDRITGFYPLTV